MRYRLKRDKHANVIDEMSDRNNVAVKSLANLGKGLLELLYPPHCYLCGEPIQGGYICDGCLNEIERVEPPICDRCGGPLDNDRLDLCPECANRIRYFHLARSYGFYEGGLAELIKALKYQGERALSKELARYLYEIADGVREQIGATYEAITFVPMTKPELKERGFNQAALLAKDLGKALGVEAFPTLIKVRETEAQTKLKAKDRLENLKGAFSCATPGPYCKSILLIDDVYTTGATANECSKVLKEGGYEQVLVLTVARTREDRGNDVD